MTDINDIHTQGLWTVLNPEGQPVDGTLATTGYSARAEMTRCGNLHWSKRVEQGYTLVSLVPRNTLPLRERRLRNGVTGATYSYMEPEIAVCQTNVDRDDIVGRTIESVELALTSRGFDITHPALKEALLSAYESMANEVG